MKAQRTTGTTAHAQITCPACGHGTISFVPQLLAMGQSFACPACGASLALETDAQAAYGKSLKDLESVAALARK